ncbi:MAG TPA: hypothetical protein VGI85_16410, partial [Chthoniobacterales bacterium]
TLAAPLMPPPAPAGRRTISFGGEMPAATASSPSLTPLVTPAAERTVALPLTELLPQIPAELLEQTEVDPAHRVLLNAAELERGLARGRPAVPLRAIYQQAPTIFTSEIGAGDEREITLPFDRVLEQIARLHVRPDQVCEEVLPQMETPFSQVTLEDSERFGTPLAPLPSTVPGVVPERSAEVENRLPTAAPTLQEASTPAPVAMPAPAATTPASLTPTPVSIVKLPPPVAAAPPATTRAEIPAAKAPSLAPIRLPMPPQTAAASSPPTNPAAPDPAQAESSLSDAALSEPPQRSGFRLIKSTISPNGTGAPATERVPASSGSPVPIPLPAPFAPPASARIPVKVTPPASDLCPPPPLPLQSAPDGETAPLIFSSEGPRIQLSLRAILREVPSFQFTGSLESIPESAQIELPFAIVEPQLSLGRIAISPAQFYAAMPEEFRAGFVLDEGGVPISLPLPEVLQNLPNESLQLRDDQEEVEVADIFETPFSQTAAEDAARLQMSAAPIVKGAVDAGAAGGADPFQAVIPTVESLNEKEQISAELETTAPKPTASPPPGSTLPATTETTPPDAKSIVARASELPGVSACAAVFSDGLCLAGNIPGEYQADALCAMAPEITKRIGEQISGANFGSMQAITVFCAKAPVSFFISDNICLAALHSADEIAPDTRARLSSITQELAQIYAQPAA